jgi:hypothetical protein
MRNQRSSALTGDLLLHSNKQATVTVHGMQQRTIKETHTQQQVIDDLNLEFG